MSKECEQYEEIGLMTRDYHFLTPKQTKKILKKYSIKTVYLKSDDHRVIVRTKDLDYIKTTLAKEYHLLDSENIEIEDSDIQQKIAEMEKTDCE